MIINILITPDTMKRLTYPGIFILLTFLLTSCEKWINPDYNIDPNQPTEVTLPLLLPTAEAGFGYAFGGDLAMPCRCWMQQLAGGANQPLGYDRYGVTASDMDNVWKWAMYAGPLMDCNRMMSLATRQNAPHYQGCAKVLMVIGMGYMTDLWGSVPYSDAFNGEGGVLQPKYDSQEAIYTTIIALLDEAITDLSAATSMFSPGGDDLIYGGDLSKWTKAAYSIKARLLLHLTKVKGNTYYTDALNALANGFAANTDDMDVFFGDAVNENNPMYQFFIDQRPGDATMGKFFVDKLVADEDPRLPQLSTGVTGSPAGSGLPGDDPGPYYCSPASPVPFISFVETKFIEAECKFQTGDAAGAATAYNEAVKANLAKLGVSDPTWEGIHANENAGSISLNTIIMGKYIGLAFQIEVFNDWKRTGIPALTPAAYNTTNNIIPRRYPYPTNEKIYNTANCPTTNVSLIDRTWWDVP